jgi:rhodanese-related sulfurtransferase
LICRFFTVSTQPKLSTAQEELPIKIVKPSCRTTITKTQKMTEVRKPGVASPSELLEFVESAGDKLVVIDLRNPDGQVEPEDQSTFTIAALPSDEYRKAARNIVWDRTTNTIPIPDLPKDTPIITHCGGGGRGGMAKDFLQKHGFKNVMNGGGPKVAECWKIYGDK